MTPESVADGKIECGSANSSTAPVFAVFDGMGGEERGEMAAYIATKELCGFRFGKNIKSDLICFCKQVNRRICQYADENELSSMGTTAALLKFAKDRIYLCNIGDSKIFRFSKGNLQQLSFDHVCSSASPEKPPLSQNLGIPESEMIISPYITTIDYHVGDLYLICSDGLTDMLTVFEIENLLLSEKENATAPLLKLALENGGKDNITLILLHVKKKKLFF